MMTYSAIISYIYILKVKKKIVCNYIFHFIVILRVLGNKYVGILTGYYYSTFICV